MRFTTSVIGLDQGSLNGEQKKRGLCPGGD